MIITDVEALLLRQPRTIASAIADGSQDALIVRVHTDEGITGIGEVDSIPLVAKAVIEAPASHKIASGLRSLLVGEDPLAIRRLWDRMYDGTIYFGRRGAAIHAISGVDIALWDIAGKAAGKPVHALLGGARRDRVKAYASTLMPETPEEARATVAAQREAGLRRGQARLGAVRPRPRARRRARCAARARRRRRLRPHARHRSGLDEPARGDPARAAHGGARARTGSRSRSCPTRTRTTRALAAAVDTPIAAGEEETVDGRLRAPDRSRQRRP